MLTEHTDPFFFGFRRLEDEWIVFDVLTLYLIIRGGLNDVLLYQQCF